MTEAKDAAFPMLGNVGHNSDWEIDYGLTKREYFAAMAMQGLFSKYGDNYGLSGIAEDSVKAADALIKELNKTA